MCALQAAFHKWILNSPNSHRALGSACLQRRLLVATAESCTGGWAAQVITHTAGSSAWFERGFVTYANEAKSRDARRSAPNPWPEFGAVSQETAAEMAAGALKNSKAMISLAITGSRRAHGWLTW
jgi:nicotinamide-nucleotide amidase